MVGLDWEDSLSESAIDSGVGSPVAPPEHPLLLAPHLFAGAYDAVRLDEIGNDYADRVPPDELQDEQCDNGSACQSRVAKARNERR